MIVLVIRTLAKAARAAMADSRVGAATSLQITVMVMAARHAPATRISIVVALAAGDRSVPRVSTFSSPEMPGIFPLRTKLRSSSEPVFRRAAWVGRADAGARRRRFRRAELVVLAMLGPQGMRKT